MVTDFSGELAFAPVLNQEHPRRPAAGDLQEVWDAAAAVPDPEIPVISIADLGILREVFLEGATAVAVITPTYSGCPAMDTITADVQAAFRSAGYPESRVELRLDEAWTTDWITEHGRAALRDYGIAPPSEQERRPAGPVSLTLSPPVACPRCASLNTHKLSHFGSTSCKSLYSCAECHEPFDYFKVLR